MITIFQTGTQEGGAGSPGGAFHAAQRVNRAAARRNLRTGSNVKVDPDLAKPAKPSLFNR